MAGLTELRVLLLESNSISDLSPLEELTQLTVLNIQTNSISDTSALAGLTQLSSLSLAFNSISDLTSLTGLTQLTTLFLNDNSISDITPLVANGGLGVGDTIELGNNALGVDDCPNLLTLTGRGASVGHEVPCA